ncbi:unnamed protein product [Cochlearia groenlandica]
MKGDGNEMLSQQHFHHTTTVDDSSSIEIVRRPRGRPPGSKNKPKPPVFVTRDNDTDLPMSPYILEIPSGNDVVEAINSFCRGKSIGVCVLSGSGSVANVTLRQPSPAAPRGSTITFHGKFDLLSLSATFLPPLPFSNFFTVSLAGPQGQIIGGFVAGPLISAGTVYVVAASFNNPTYHMLPLVEEETRISEEDSMYSCHVGASDVVWAPTARPPPSY